MRTYCFFEKKARKYNDRQSINWWSNRVILVLLKLQHCTRNSDSRIPSSSCPRGQDDSCDMCFVATAILRISYGCTQLNTFYCGEGLAFACSLLFSFLSSLVLTIGLGSRVRTFVQTYRVNRPAATVNTAATITSSVTQSNVCAVDGILRVADRFNTGGCAVRAMSCSGLLLRRVMLSQICVPTRSRGDDSRRTR